MLPINGPIIGIHPMIMLEINAIETTFRRSRNTNPIAVKALPAPHNIRISLIYPSVPRPPLPMIAKSAHMPRPGHAPAP